MSKKQHCRNRIFAMGGFSLVEVLSSIVILVVVASFVAYSIIQQKNTVTKYSRIAECRAALSRTMGRISSGNRYGFPDPTKFKVSPSMGLPPATGIYDLTGLPAEKSSLILNSTRTFGARFAQFGVVPLRLFDPINQTTAPYSSGTYAFAPVTGLANVVTDNDGIVLYTPLFMQGVVADLAEIYDLNRGVKVDLPADFEGIPGEDIAAPLIEIKIDRYKLSDNTIDNFAGAGHFWPIPRNQFGIIDDPNGSPVLASQTSSYAVRDPLEGSFLLGGIAQHGYRLAQIPRDPDALFMSWDYGFRVTLSLNGYKPIGSDDPLDCEMQKDFSLPTDFHNVMALQSDIDIVEPQAQVTASPQVAVSSRYTDKVPLLPTLSDKMYAVFTNRVRTGSPTYSKDLPNNRPECSQDALVKQNFKIRLHFTNLSKEPGVIPMCLDTSFLPSGLRNAAGTDYTWCAGGGNAQTLIVGPNSGGAQPGRGGWVPCENLQLCREAPKTVAITAPGPDDVTYEYTYEVDNNDNTAARNKLWGCALGLQTALLDPVGNLTYIHANGAMTMGSATPLVGGVRPQMSSVNPFIYFKPPPCQQCNCKPCKSGGKNLFKILLVVVAIAVVIFAAPAIMGYAGWVMGSGAAIGAGGVVAPLTAGTIGAALGAATGWTLTSLAIVGIIPAALSLCMVQAVASASGGGGACAIGGGHSFSAAAGKYYRCNEGGNPACSCGFTCQKLDPPDPFQGMEDPVVASMIGAQNPNLSCAPSQRPATDSGLLPAPYNWIAKAGVRDATGLLNPTLLAEVGQKSIYTMVDKANGVYCFAKSSCEWNAVASKAEWAPYVDPADPETGPYSEGCVPLKIASTLNFDGLGGVSKGPETCLKPDTGAAPLESCAYFDCQAYEGAGVYSKAKLLPTFTTPAGFKKIAGKKGGPVSIPTYPTPPGPVAFPVQLTKANCTGMISVGGAGSGFEQTAPHLALYPPDGPFTIAATGASYIASADCAASFDNSTNTFPCTCTPIGGHLVAGVMEYTGCAGDDPANCTLNATNTACNSSTCIETKFQAWQSWNSCTPPASELEEYMVNSTDGMYCFDPWNPATGVTNLCDEGVPPPAGALLLSNSVDMTCPGGTCCGGVCTWP